MRTSTDRAFNVFGLVVLVLIVLNQVAESRVPAWDGKGAPVTALLMGFVMLGLAVKLRLEKGTWVIPLLIVTVADWALAIWMALS